LPSSPSWHPAGSAALHPAACRLAELSTRSCR
jgi:hypothetical protein